MAETHWLDSPGWLKAKAALDKALVEIEKNEVAYRRTAKEVRRLIRFLRPSRGKRKHVRREKARRRACG